MANIRSSDNIAENKSYGSAPKSLWPLICHHLRPTISEEDFNVWIAPIKSKQSSENELTLIIPNMVFYQCILDRFLEKFDQIKSALGVESLLISLAIEEDETQPHKQENDEFDGQATPTANESPVSMLNSRALTDKGSSLNPAYKFNNFVCGQSNKFAHAACSTVAGAPGQAYNPLFIYGSTGLGKTHLLQAVGHQIQANKIDPVILYVSSERFMNEMIYCLRFNKMWEFRRKYRSCDVFLVDDIQFISGKDRTQEEFFHTFNALYENKKQIVITSDLFPQELPEIEERLRNRFQWGLIADIQPPTVEHRVEILMSKARSLGVELLEDVAFYIATHAKKNIRELEGSLHRICAFATLQGRPIDMNLASETYQNVAGDAPKRLTIETIQKIVADHYKIKVADLKSKKRQRAWTVPRQIAMYLARMRTQSSFPEIGAKFGGKDHTTVMHAVKKVDQDRLNDFDLKTSIEAIERRIEQQT